MTSPFIKNVIFFSVAMENQNPFCFYPGRIPLTPSTVTNTTTLATLTSGKSSVLSYIPVKSSPIVYSTVTTLSTSSRLTSPQSMSQTVALPPLNRITSSKEATLVLPTRTVLSESCMFQTTRLVHHLTKDPGSYKIPTSVGESTSPSVHLEVIKKFFMLFIEDDLKSIFQGFFDRSCKELYAKYVYLIVSF